MLSSVKWRVCCQDRSKFWEPSRPFPWFVPRRGEAVWCRMAGMVNAVLWNTHLQFPSHLNTPSAPAPLRNTRKGELGHTWALSAPKVTQLSKPKGLQQAFHLLMGSLCVDFSTFSSWLNQRTHCTNTNLLLLCHVIHELFQFQGYFLLWRGAFS